MGWTRDGIPASPGIAIGPARVLHFEPPRVPEEASGAVHDVLAEVERLRAACAMARAQTRQIQARTAARLGSVEARIFEPLIMMLEDPELVGRAEAYILENHLSAARAFEVRVLEWQSQWAHTAHPMVLDKLNDLADLHTRVLHNLLDLPDPQEALRNAEQPVIVVAAELAPSHVVQLEPSMILGLALGSGTRASHTAILARSLGLPAVVSLGDIAERLRDGTEMILDGRVGRVVVAPSGAELQAYRERDHLNREWEEEQLRLVHLDAITTDGVRVALRANLDLPSEAVSARAHGADGVGLLRTEFLVVGRGTAPGEEEQFTAYRSVVEAFGGAPVIIRTYDLGGDKFPQFLHMPAEENPFLGWRAIRVCLDEVELFRVQLRALLRASALGNVQLMLPLVNEISEIETTRELLNQVASELRAEGVVLPHSVRLGIMIETPAAAVCAASLASHVDFFSIGTNDLVQYTLAVDRGNSRLANRYNPFHPAVIRLIQMVADAGASAGIEVSVCGEMAAHPLGAFLLLGLGIPALSVGPGALVEIRKVIRSSSAADSAAAARRALQASTADEVVATLTEALRQHLPEEIMGNVLGLPIGRAGR